MKTFLLTVIVSLITSTCNTKCLEERILILSSFSQKLQLKQAEEGQVFLSIASRHMTRCKKWDDFWLPGAYGFPIGIRHE